jgi:hypothetical protein
MEIQNIIQEAYNHHRKAHREGQTATDFCAFCECEAKGKADVLNRIADMLQDEAKDTTWFNDGETMFEALQHEFKEFPQDYDKWLYEREKRKAAEEK